jgi:negative regulator of flagellin synthesis FlgM
MDRIDTQVSKGVSSSARVKGAAPVVRAEAVGEPGGGGAGKADGIALASVVTVGTEVPVEHERVAEIRKAIEQGHYPITPVKIADAMIAAGYLLRTPS